MRQISDRISVDEKPGRTSIVIFGKVARWKESLLLFWILAWSFSGTVFLYYFLADTPQKYSVLLFILLVFWAFFEIRALKVFFWRRSGFEHIVISDERIIISNKLLGRGKERKFNVDEIEGISERKVSNKNFFAFLDQSFWMLGGEQLHFRTNKRDVIFGKQINQKEQQSLILILKGSIKKEKSRMRKVIRKESKSE